MSEIDKIKRVKDKSQAIGEFLDWLGEKKIVLARWGCESDILYPLTPEERNPEYLLAEFYNIDLEKLEQEKMQILKDIRGIKA